MRVIFDRSSFHGDRFPLLRDSPILECQRRRLLTVYHTEVFLNETLEAGISQGADGSWRDHLEFALEICNGGLFLAKENIWHGELVQGRGPFARRLYPARQTRKYWSESHCRAQLREAAQTKDLSAAATESKEDRAESRKKRENQRQAFAEIRDNVSKALKSGKLSGTLKQAKQAFWNRLPTEQTNAGRQLMAHVSTRRTDYLADIWQEAPDRYPFYTAFVQGFVYAMHYAAVEHNFKIDSNAQADYEQLCYLNWADVIVTDDAKFMKVAFDNLWAPRGKRLETSASFATLVTRLAG